MSDIFAKYASIYAERYDLAVFPCKELQKVPRTKNGCNEATKEKFELEAWSKKWPKSNIGIATGTPSGVWVLDLDGEEAEQWLFTQEALPITPEVITAKGRHLYFKMPTEGNITNSASQVAPKIDVRGTGGYVIAPPSVHPDGGIYEWHEDRKPATTPFAQAPEWLLALVVKRPFEYIATDVQKPANPSGDKYVRKVLDDEYRILSNAPEGTRNEQLFKSTAAMANYIGQAGVTQSIVHELVVAGAQANGVWQQDGSVACLKTIESALRTGLSHPKQVPESNYTIGPTKPRIALIDDKGEEIPWHAELLKNSDGAIQKRSFHNGLVVLERHPLMQGVLIYNAFSDLVIFEKSPPWEKSASWKPRALRDDDATACTSWLETPEAGSLSIRPHDAYNIMLRVAKLHEIDPPREWLQKLKWDGIERLSDWLPTYCEVDDNAYTQTVGRKFLIGAVKRIMEPGSKMDSMLILEGDQGHMKSTALRVLATWGNECYFTDQVDDISNKDALIQIQGVAIIEFAEMDTLNKSDTDHIKKFITRQIDRYRPPYGKTLIDRPRRCVFAGTVNPGGNGYLKDPTGARRFWPVLVNDKIDLSRLAEIGPSLWAEAYHAWEAGEKNWIDDPVVLELAMSEQSKRYEEEAWGDLIDKKLRHVDAITMPDLMEAIGIPKERRDNRASKRIGAHMRHRGWISRKDYRVHNDSSPQRRFYPPIDHQVVPEEPKVEEYGY